ncbi:MAG: glutamate synthase-related protein [Chloroflexota bacterium]|nr:glutamate synthase-related protein [Chloroflexota bacterium]
MQSDNPTPDVPPLHLEDTRERDACALICAVRKGGEPTHGNVKRTIEALTRMGHRTGIVEGEGDGVGIMTDIPRRLWTKALAHKGLRSSLAADNNFWVAHLMIPAHDRDRTSEVVEAVCRRIGESGLELLIDRPGVTNSIVLGQSARKNEPVFWQFAGMNGRIPLASLERTLYRLQTTIEREMSIHFPSFSSRSVVYKVQGTVEILRRYYPELRDPEYASGITLGHARYSTNTNPIFERVQPFNVMGHNGEFNTISRFRLEATMLGVELDPANSDSQDVDRMIDGLCMQYDLDLIEAMEYIFPPFQHDLIETAPDIHEMYANIRRAFGPFAQGPAAVVARVGDHCVFSVDALGLRPLWFGETEKEYFASSERGVYTLDAMSADPKPLAPGEKIALIAKRGQPIEVLDYPAIQRHTLNKFRDRAMFGRMNGSKIGLSALTQPIAPHNGGNGHGNGHGNGSSHEQPAPVVVTEAYGAMAGQTRVASAPARFAYPAASGLSDASAAPATWTTPVNTTTMAALGWERYHLSVIESLSESGKELIGSLGWDGPLAAMSHTRVNMTDYFKETVAVVTNPAIDRERELAQFSTAVLLGVRPQVGTLDNGGDLLVQLDIPLLIGGHPTLGSPEAMQAIAQKHGTMTLDELIDVFGERIVRLATSAAADERIEDALRRLADAAVEAVQGGALCILLDDADALDGARLWLDPLLVVSTLDRALRSVGTNADNLRRRAGIIVRSGALRDLHDVMMCLSFGANALIPYAMYAVALDIAPKAPKQPLDDARTVELLNNMVKALVTGMQKVTSTIGCHELRGYGHAFSSVGLASEVAATFDTPNYFGSAARGTTFADMRIDLQARATELRGEKPTKLDNPDRLYPKMWKKIEDIALGEMTLDEYTDAMLKLEAEIPIAPRHLLGLRTRDAQIDPATVDISVTSSQHTHAMPALIGAMSFGSQGRLAYSAYGEAAYRLNIICVNGEGGELPDVMGKYPRHRGNQIASARFGVNIGFLNSCDILEIKIGQGAKPGEGGQLPGYKVTEEVALARSTSPWVDLISPSNNHDLYSIEDLAQLIDELKTANPNARVSVKVPVVPGVGIIAVGIAKAGADIINITGYEGGTGAARAHSLRHVGLPAEIGLWLAHRALTESGLRDDVELWADGGMKSGRDVIKMLCLGANRVGFGTLAMVAVGCTICRKCHEGTCHVGITTHIKTVEEALEKGIKHFEPREYENAVQGIVNVFNMLSEDIRRWTAKMGFTRTQDLVGRADLLEQIAMHDQIDLTPLTMRVPHREKKPLQPGIGVRLARPRNTLSKQITSVIAEHALWGDYELTYDDEQVMAMDRALGTHLSGALKRGDVPNTDKIVAVHLNFSNSAIPGNGLAAFIDAPVDVLVEGGAQDGVGKCARGGAVTILKGLNHNGQRLDGGVGKSFAYGAQGGRFIVQGYADTRACIRLSGADVIFGSEIEKPLRDELGGLATRSNLKGYACEYMTSGRVLVLGDPGPWLCAGMSGGAVYQRIQPEMNLTIDAVRRRLAKGALVDILPMDEQGMLDVQDLLGYYIYTLEQNNQGERVAHLYALLARPQDHFIKIARPNRKN